MDSNVSHHKYDPIRDEFEAYESVNEPAEMPAHRHSSSGSGHVHGQISFEAPWVFLPDLEGHGSLKHVSLEQIEFEMERSARRQED